MMLSNDDTPDPVQAFRPVHKSHKPSSVSAPLDSDDVILVDCHTDPETHKDFILWMDIQQAFDGALLVRHKTKLLAFLKGPDYQILEPRRIAAVSGIVLDVVVGGELPDVDVRIVQDLSISAPPLSHTTPNLVYGLEEQATENYNHVERPATSLLSFQGPQVTSAPDHQEGDGSHRASTGSQPTVGSTSAQRCDGPQGNSAAISMDLMQTMIRASQGDADAQVALGDRYKKSDGVSRDRQTALDWYRKAAEQGHSHAQCNIGLMFCAENCRAETNIEHMIYNNQFLGQYTGYDGDSELGGDGDSELGGDDDIPRDKDKGLEWLLKAAQQGLAAAQLAVAMFMVSDCELDQANPDPTSLSTMFDWCRKAADQDHVMAQIFLVLLYGLGLGVSKDGSEAVNSALKAVNRSSGFAECMLGWSYLDGEWVSQDDSTAFEWFVKGAEQGNNESQFEVAKSYEKGNGVPVDREKAIEWYTKASQNGHRQARDSLDRLTAKLERLSMGDAMGVCVEFFYIVVVMVVWVIILQKIF